MNALPTSLRLAFGPFLRKEWRDHRAIVLAIAVVLPLLTLLFEFAFPSFIAGNPLVPDYAALVAFAIVALALCGDLFAGEERRGTIALLRRLPGGWGPTFAAKLALLTLVTGLLCAEAFGVATLAIRALHGTAAEAVPGFAPFRWRVALLLLASLLLVPAWSIVVSIWFPRGALALPGAIVVLALFAAPIALAIGLNPGVGTSLLRPEDLALAALALLVVAAPAVAAISFARGRCVERERWRAGAVGALATFVLFTPAYGWTALRVHLFRSVDPKSASFHVNSQSSRIATNGRFAYVTGFHSFVDPWAWRFQTDPSAGDGPDHALRIDLQDGTWRALAGAGSGFSAIPDACGSFAVPYLALCVRGTSKRERIGMLGAKWESSVMPLVDTERGEVARPDFDESFTGAMDDDGARFQRLANSSVLADGSRFWLEHGHVVRTTPDGGTRVLPDSEVAPDSTTRRWIAMQPLYGHGVWLGEWTVYDVDRERRFTTPKETMVVGVRAGNWIVVHELAKRKFGTWCEGWNPETGEFGPIVGATKDDSIAMGIADDGRLFVGRDREPGKKQNRPWRRLYLLDPDSGAQEQLTFSDEIERNLGVRLEARTPTGRPVMSILMSDGERMRFARFDLVARRFDVAAPDATVPLFLIGCADEESIVVTDGHRLLRAFFGKPGLRVLFPK